ncbi:methyltransferase domain-containing protein [Candidatus Dependentiae bacterium]|nr:methyltransferase domain-containing protein [Candidatus Dependentiae bacterium]
MNHKNLFFIILILIFAFIFANSNISTFIFMFLKEPKEVGALTPLTSYTAKKLIEPIKNFHGPKNILEVGAGTGVVTDELLKELKAQDNLDVIEKNEKFCAIMSDKLKDSAKNIKFYCMPIEDFSSDKKYDFIISTLPFNSFPKELILKVFEKYKSLLKKDGYVHYIEYALLAKLKRFFLSKQQKLEYDEAQATIKAIREKYLIKKILILWNFPPTYVYYLKI